MDFTALVRTIPDYPKQGIMFRDITTLLADAGGFRAAVDALVERYRPVDVDLVVGIEARGFILGGAVAHQLGKGFVPIRKKGKLPWKTIGQEYSLEYGTDVIEIHEDATAGRKVLIVDDLIATGGTAVAAAKLVEKSGGTVSGACFIIELPALGGRPLLEGMGIPVSALCSFEGD